MAIGPASMVPMTTKVRLINRNGHDMTHPGRNVAVASRAEVGLRCFVGLDATDINIETHWVLFSLAHLSRRTPR